MICSLGFLFLGRLRLERNKGLGGGERMVEEWRRKYNEDEDQ